MAKQRKKYLINEDEMSLELIKGSAEGTLKIVDKTTNEVLVEQQNAVHFGNLSAAIAKALAGDSNGHIKFVAFGNGGTSITELGTIFYRAPNVSVLRDETAALYNETYQKDVSVGTDENNIAVILSNVNYADVKVTVTLDFGEPADQDLVDNATNNDGDYVFDEIALKTAEGLFLTHIIFHPVQKALNRIIEIEYTLRIQMG